MIHHTQVHYLVERNDSVTGPDGWFLNLIRDSDGHERFEFTSNYRSATFMDEHTAYEKLHSCRLHFEGHYEVKKLQIDFRISNA